jgi:hypothetical protein
MPKRITRLRIDEASLVDRPANVGARVVLFKRAGGSSPGNQRRWKWNSRRQKSTGC